MMISAAKLGMLAANNVTNASTNTNQELLNLALKKSPPFRNLCPFVILHLHFFPSLFGKIGLKLFLITG